jgi:fermentation-respiration switch protein FrsA (DUF1100 family)
MNDFNPSPGGPVVKRLIPVLLSLAIAGCGTWRAPAPATAEAPLHASATRGGLDGWMDEVFRLADTDHDGTLSRPETELSAPQFAAFDRDGDGHLARTEWEAKASLAEILTRLPAFMPLVDALRTRLDTDRDRGVSLAEIRTTLGASRAAVDALRDSAVSGAFRQADADHDGRLSGEEFKAFYLGLGTPAERGLVQRVTSALLGAYLAVTSHIATPGAIYPKRVHPKATPAKLGIPFEDVSFPTEDGLTLRAWYVPAKAPTDKAVVVVHGHASCRDMAVTDGQLAMLHDDYNVLAIDLRNNGASDGTVTTFGYHEGKDVVAAVRYLKTRGNTRLAVYGVSMGAATVIRGAVLAPEVKAIWEDCAYATVVSAFKGFISITFVPCPVLIATATLANANRILGIDMTETEPVTQVAKLAPRPLMVVHGAADPVITSENGRIVYYAAGDHVPKDLWIVPGAGHGQSPMVAKDAYRQRLLEFLRKAM